MRYWRETCPREKYEHKTYEREMLKPAAKQKASTTHLNRGLSKEKCVRMPP